MATKKNTASKKTARTTKARARKKKTPGRRKPAVKAPAKADQQVNEFGCPIGIAWTARNLRARCRILEAGLKAGRYGKGKLMERAKYHLAQYTQHAKKAARAESETRRTRARSATRRARA